MVLLTIVRRILIIVVACGILVDSVLLLMASNAREARAGNANQNSTYKLVARVDTKEAAESLAKAIRQDKADLSPKVTVRTANRPQFVETGLWRCEMRFRKESSGNASTFATKFKNLKVPVAVEDTEDGGKAVVYTGQKYRTKAEAEKGVDMLLSKTALKMEPFTEKQKKSIRAYLLEVTVSDPAALETIHDMLTGKAVVEQ